MSERKPLTLEELRKMDDKPVLVESDSDYIPGGVYLCEWCDWKEEARLWSYEGENWFIGKYDKGVKVYAYAVEPLCLDRSAWEPCEVCEELKDPCLEDGCFKKMETGKVCGYNCTRFVKYQKNIKRLHEAKFCPECGRPLTDAAWDTLEKRLDGSE